jgi:hypothetical protein
MGLINTFTLIKFCINSGTQYAAIVGASASGNFSTIGLKVLLEPITGLGTSYQFIKAAQTAAERRARISTLAAFLATSTLSVTQLDPATNIAVGASVASKIAYMWQLLLRGGATNQITKLNFSSKDYVIIVDSIKTPVLEIHPYRREFTSNSKIIIDNMFQEHTGRRYLQGSIQRIKTIPSTSLIPIVSSQITTTSVIGWTTLGVGLISFTTLGLLHLFQHVECKRWKNQNEAIVIDMPIFKSE